jgi:hypothetical protein
VSLGCAASQRWRTCDGRSAAGLLPLLPPLHSTPIHNPNLPNAPMATASGHEGAHEAGWVQGEGEEVVSPIERAIAEHLACAPIGMQPEALAHELWVLIGPELKEVGSE